MTNVSQTLTYAGIGSRKTPSDVLELIESIAATLALRGWIARRESSERELGSQGLLPRCAPLLPCRNFFSAMDFFLGSPGEWAA